MTIPATIGKYEVSRRLGGGGMAEVYLARLMGAEGFSRTVAIKRVLPGYSESAAFAAMFIQEAQLSARLTHPNVVSVLDFDRDPQHGLFLAMEMVEGRDLSDLLSTGPLPFSLVIYLTTEILRGLGYAHNLPGDGAGGVRGLVHRDVSPHNVLLSWEGAVKVSDFGIAKARGAATAATASVMLKGKPSYMSPEQANGEPLDGRSDLFAVGIMLWEMLVGRLPFVGDHVQAILSALFFARIPAPRELRPEVPADLSRVVMRLLERNPAQRYRSAEEAIDALLACRDAPRDGRSELTETLLTRYPSQAPPRTSRTHAVAVGTPSDGTAAPAVRRNLRKYVGVFLGVGVAAAALTLAGIALAHRPQAHDAQRSGSVSGAASVPAGAMPAASPAIPPVPSAGASETASANAARIESDSPGAPAPQADHADAPPKDGSSALRIRTRAHGPEKSEATKSFVPEQAPNALQPTGE